MFILLRKTATVAVLLGSLLAITWTAHALDSSGSTRSMQDQTAHNKMVARQVFEAGLSEGRFEVPYTDDFVGHGGGAKTFTHDDGLAEAKGWRQAFPDLHNNQQRGHPPFGSVCLWRARG